MTRPQLRTLVLGAVLAIGLAAGAVAVQVRSQAILAARFPLRPSPVRAATTPEALAEGRHLVQVAACSLCHGRALAGEMLGAAGSPVSAPNLTLVVRRRSDAELDRAIRAGLRPDGTSELGMPSHVYMRFTDAEMAAMLGYLRSLPPAGSMAPRPSPGFVERADLVLGLLHPEVRRVAAATPPLDLGPRFAEGRHLTSFACGQCHGTDLSGSQGAPGPDLMVRGGYDLGQFRTLMREGQTPSGRQLDPMSLVARTSFSHFTDGEIDAIYAYLDARDVKLASPAH